MCEIRVASTLQVFHRNSWGARSGIRRSYRGTSLIRYRPHPLGPPEDPRHSPTIGSYEGAVSYERGTPVHLYSKRNAQTQVPAGLETPRHRDPTRSFHPHHPPFEYCARLLLVDFYQGRRFPAAFAEKLSKWSNCSFKGPEIPTRPHVSTTGPVTGNPGRCCTATC